jgi:hypothetical protein
LLRFCRKVDAAVAAADAGLGQHTVAPFPRRSVICQEKLHIQLSHGPAVLDQIGVKSRHPKDAVQDPQQAFLAEVTTGPQPPHCDSGRCTTATGDHAGHFGRHAHDRCVETTRAKLHGDLCTWRQINPLGQKCAARPDLRADHISTLGAIRQNAAQQHRMSWLATAVLHRLRSLPWALAATSTNRPP